MPIIIHDVPHSNKFIRAEQIMNKDVMSISGVETVQNIYKIL